MDRKKVKIELYRVLVSVDKKKGVLVSNGVLHFYGVLAPTKKINTLDLSFNETKA